MNDATNRKAGKFLYRDENVEYSVDKNGSDVTIYCDYPVFLNRFAGNHVTLPLQDFYRIPQKGHADYEFFQKLTADVQEYLLDWGL